MTTFQFQSPLSLTTCLDRIVSTTDGMGRLFPHRFNGTKQILAFVHRKQIRLCKQLSYQNSFQTFLYARLEAEGDKTRIRGCLRMHTLVIGFLVLWFGMPLIAIITGLIMGGNPRQGTMVWYLLLFGVGLVVVGRWMARKEGEMLTRYLRETLEAN
jgi:hypothetical protein